MILSFLYEDDWLVGYDTNESIVPVVIVEPKYADVVGTQLSHTHDQLLECDSLLDIVALDAERLTVFQCSNSHPQTGKVIGDLLDVEVGLRFILRA